MSAFDNNFDIDFDIDTANIAIRLTVLAEEYPDMLAVAEPLRGYGKDGKRKYRTITFAELNADSDSIAAALIQSGVEPGMRLALFVRYGIDFISLVFAVCKTGATLVLIDPGMGIRRMFDCLSEIEPDGFLAVPEVHIARLFYRRRFPKSVHNLTVGRRWFWGGLSLAKIRKTKSGSGKSGSKKTRRKNAEMVAEVMDLTMPDDPAAIIFTSGSTGPAKGVLFSHRNFNTQVSEIAERFSIETGEIDLACFPFFGLFDALMGVSAIIPDMNTSRPATVDPKKIVEQAEEWKITQSFASPAVWKKVADYCTANKKVIGTLKRAVSAGAPVSAAILEKLKPCINPQGDIYTPYGATEALPVASISAEEVLKETAFRTDTGGGVCVGRRFPSVEWKIIKISDEPIKRFEFAEEVPQGEVGELAVTGPQVTKMYVNRPQANAAAKMLDSGGRIWHRMGDVGYFDEYERFWFCGRKAHRVERANDVLFTIPCEAVFNQHPAIYRSALTGSPNSSGARIFVEPLPEHYPKTKKQREKLLTELLELGKRNPITETITDIRVLKRFPVDVRHNIKINRELLAEL